MKFSCDQCKTRYSIADERVRGKVLKIRCKHCSNIITVRDEGTSKAPGPQEKGALERAMERALSDSPAAAYQGSDSTLIGTVNLFGSHETPPAQDVEEWHISIDGVASGPFQLQALAERAIAERAADREVFVWRDGFDDWLPPEEVEDVRLAVTELEQKRPGRQKVLSAPPKPKPVAAAPTPAVKQPAKAVAELVDQVESFEFSDTPPTATFVRTPMRELLPRAAAPTKDKVKEKEKVPAAAAAPAAIKGPPLRGFDKKPPPLPFDVPKAPPAQPESAKSHQLPISQASIDIALVNLPDLGLPGITPPASAGSPVASRTAASGANLATTHEPLVKPESNVQFNITEPSQIINLQALINAVHPTPAAKAEAEGAAAVLPKGADQALGAPAPAATGPAPQVVVMAGPAPAASNQRLKMVLSLSLAACVLLLGTVIYLVTHRGDQEMAVTRRGGLQINDHPIAISEDPRYPSKPPPADTTAPEAAVHKNGNGNGNGKRVPKLPAAAAGKGQLSGNAAVLAKLYEDGAGTAPNLPAARQGGGAQQAGGVSEAELQDVVRRNQKSLSACYERVLKHDDSLRRARIDVQVKVGISGTVTHVSVDGALGNGELSTCLQQVIRRWHFPPSDSDYETQFPLILTAS